VKFRFILNGEARTLEAAADAILLDVLRDAGFKGVKYGCHEGVCGACTVLLDGRAIYACMTFVGQVDGREVTTIEGVGTREDPHPLQRELVAVSAVQCGFCTPGMVLAAHSLLAENPAPERAEIAHALDGNLCRCTGYVKIFKGVESAARRLRGEE
jgi:aerobic-type carbon monoxide dehydrogenase small subunit (CoxS/CutS family)